MQIATPDELLARACAEPAIASIASALDALGAEVYVAGGTVRDLILGRAFIDVDLAIDGDTLILAKALGGADGSETRFGTLSVDRGGVRYDIARTRSERYSHPGALPEVAPAGIEADLDRRDFTVNAFALGLTGPDAGLLVAAPNAAEDLAAKRLAVLHDRSFIDDPTRLLRLARYTVRLAFEPAPHTRELAAQAIAAGALETISGTRIGNELRLLATEPDPVAAFEEVQALGLPWLIDGEQARRALEVLPKDGRADLLVLGCVFGAEQDQQVSAELDRLEFTAGERDVIVAVATRAVDLAERLAGAASSSEIARTVGSAGIETVARASSRGARLQSLTWLQDLRHRQLKINGDDLIQNGLSEGPQLGEALARARDALMDGTALDRESQLRVALNAGE